MTKQEQIKFIEDNYPLYINNSAKRRLRHNFFSNIETEIQAYLLGFYAADGNINEKRKTFRIHLQAQDSELVYLYKDIISPDAYLFHKCEHLTKGRNGQTITAHESIGVDINSIIICLDLIKLGFGYNKSYSDLHIPNIPEHLKRHFIRGYFDGDGCITSYLVHETGKNDRVRGCFNIDSKTICICNEIMKFFSDHDIKVNINYLKRDNMYRLTSSSKKELTKIFHILYDDSNFYLTRKFNKFNHYVNTEVTQLITEHRNALEVNVNESNNPPKSVEHSILNENVR